MTTLNFEKMEILAAELGGNNSMPDFKNVDYIHAGYDLTDKIEDDEKQNIGKGMINTLLPYQIQDGYNRDRKPKKFDVAIIENEKIKAVFIPQLGGRLWSLYHKEKKRELLYVNSVFQPANLALRNAWFSGGVEWNVGIKGHNPLTCSPLFAQKLEGQNNEPILRMYEYERIRDIVYSLEVSIPDNSDVLYIKVKIENTSSESKYMYWWSNIAVPQTNETRVIVPTDDSFLCFYNEGHYVLDKSSIPYKDGIDVSYPVNLGRSQDFFYKIPKESAKWIAAVEKDGKGLLHFSTKELIGRKLFLWGQSEGGKNWNTWLSNEGEEYIEIQAGLLKTQLEHFLMEGNSEIEWVEGYALADCDETAVNSEDWKIAQNEVVKCLNNYIEINNIDIVLKDIFKITKEGNIYYNGSGWGALENLMRKKENINNISNSLIFNDDSFNCEQMQWLKLINDGYLPCENIETPPISYIVSAFWMNLLEESIENGKSAHWYGFLQLGVMKYANGELEQSRICFERSIEQIPNAWAYRNLAMLEKNEFNNIDKAKEIILKAVQLNNTYRGLMVNCAEILIESNSYKLWLDIFRQMNVNLKYDGRLRFFKSICLINLGEIEKANEIINDKFVMDDIKEGEFSISHIWFKLYRMILQRDTGISDETELDKLVLERYPLPKKLDFRMH